MLLDLYNNNGNAVMNEKLKLINEQTSPLHHITWIYNADEPQRRALENNICSFHIGNGYFLSAAHNLRTQQGFYRSISEDLYKQELFPKLDGSQTRLMDAHYFYDGYTHKRYLNNIDPVNLQAIANVLKQKRFDTRWVSLAEKKICTPHLMIHFKEKNFYQDPALTSLFNEHKVIYDQVGQRHGFLLEVSLVHAFYEADIALYKLVDAPIEIINKIPAIDIDLTFLDESKEDFYCLQDAPSHAAGRLINSAKIEGLLDHFNIFIDDIGGNYIFEGYRYLVKGYFRFGSSGAPYLLYDTIRGKYLANAVQSEASGIQLAIKNDREGNFQYVNAIASPLYIIKDELQRYLGLS
jgi:hypothetical protein